MSETKQAVVISTLGQLLDKGYSFNLWCLDCSRGGISPIAPFVMKLGRDHPIYVRGHAKCSKCGRKNVEVRIQAPAAGERTVQG
ncbi:MULTISPECIES: hypothetical protein [unclassified Ensifer]|uniref:hypothetical protein n=1 Tax=unclassified Ensifer TaxID=2633371 RepID=UPI00070E09EE|nr:MULTISPECIES: hypothetical protein [unclassified Ensifer]KQW62846.1 hypothetical protein ASD02_01610 [Ensifer sp. Root1252]KRC83667.1 hypothetical protein ASE32_01600 [Ensifer sp. Root231]KRD04020.1 hypothetical protein ASE47_00260 [Ensifer sp. Root258]